MNFYKILLKVAFIVLLVSHNALASPVVADSRIKTLVYNENEVFQITVHYGYQTNIEFAKGEEIETLSMGRSYAWNITPVGRRLFIKALEGSAHTNMTLITNKRTYQFELQSKDGLDGLNNELVYVVRFYYPEENFDTPAPTVDMNKFLPEPSWQDQTKQPFNFDYMLTGPESIAPIKVFDDGDSTFLEFANDNALVPHIFEMSRSDQINRLKYARKGGYIVVNKVVPELILKHKKDQVRVLNEKLLGN